MLERRVLVMTLVCDRQCTMQGLFKALKKSAFASSMAPTIMIAIARSGNNNLCHI